MIPPSSKRVAVRVWTLANSYRFINPPIRYYSVGSAFEESRPLKRRQFHDYFVTHLPSSSLHPDPRGPITPFHKLPRSASVPHTGETSHSPASFQPAAQRETTVVRIPLRSAKHHFGASSARGTRPANEDTYQAGVIDIPAFAKRPPASLTIRRPGAKGSPPPPEGRGAETARGDPQVFYFGIFDGHGGAECSTFLKERLHEYIQNATAEFELESSLKKRDPNEHSHDLLPIIQGGNRERIGDLEKDLVHGWRSLVGGYFKRFMPAHFSYYGNGPKETDQSIRDTKEENSGITIEEVMEYAFLRADLDFVTAQAAKSEDDIIKADLPLNQDDVLYGPSHLGSLKIGGKKRFKGGSTGSTAMISTPTPTPFWHPAAPSSLLVSHVGDTRIILCSTATGEAIPLTSNHHPSSPIESNRLRRYAATFVTDSFGEERMSGLANTRAFGDIHSKRMGVSAEPEVRRIEMGAAEYSFLVLTTAE
ncbi:phosphatase 2C [Aspergillus sclerotialis]|uniref:Phosphatase 2C n=1 Tax=Aspergillus sclerotialis TaxID=2070753 RepID=A0A3A2ZQ96_9EURO|nr:phosphatase 2C [Aspergillus sclerotialis]